MDATTPRAVREHMTGAHDPGTLRTVTIRVDDYIDGLLTTIKKQNDRGSDEAAIQDALEAIAATVDDGWTRVTRQADGTYGPMPKDDRYTQFEWWTELTIHCAGKFFDDKFFATGDSTTGLDPNKVLCYRKLERPADIDALAEARRRELAGEEGGE
jgi:hypothetical protein